MCDVSVCPKMELTPTCSELTKATVEFMIADRNPEIQF